MKTFRSYTPTMRWTVTPDFKEITKRRPEKNLTIPRKESGGRNVYGRVTSRHRGGGHKQRIRIIDFKRDKLNIPARVIAIEYDPIRSARLALLEYEDKERRYILAPQDLKAGEQVISADTAEIKPGNNLTLRAIPPGIPVHNLELIEGKGGQGVRSAGSSATLLAKENDTAQVRMPSGEVRLVSLNCRATIGTVGNIEHDAVSIGKAGRSRHMGIRPWSRAVAKNPVDHPMGGGEGKSSGGRHPCSRSGIPAKGYKTRQRNKPTNKFIVKRRNQ